LTALTNIFFGHFRRIPEIMLYMELVGFIW